MAQLSLKEKESKKNALMNAIQRLKEISSPKNNKVTQTNVVKLANQCEDSQLWLSNIHVNTLKNNDTDGLGFEARNMIIGFKNELKQTEKSANTQLLKKIKTETQQNGQLIEQIVKLLDNELEFKKAIEQLEKTIDRKNEEIQSLKNILKGQQ